MLTFPAPYYAQLTPSGTGILRQLFIGINAGRDCFLRCCFREYFRLGDGVNKEL